MQHSDHNSRVEINRSLVLKNSLVGVLTQIANLGMLVWTQHYLLCRISPEEYSLYPIALSVMSWSMLFAYLPGLGSTRFITEAYAKGDERRIVGICSTVFIGNVLASVALLVGGVLFCVHVQSVLSIPRGLRLESQEILGTIFVSLVIKTIASTFESGIVVKQRFVLLNAISLGTTIVRIAMIALLLLGVSAKVLWLVVASQFAEILGSIGRLVISVRLVPCIRVSLREVNKGLIRELFSYNSWSLIASIAFTIRTSANPLILNRFGTALDVSCFYIGTMILNSVRTAFTSIGKTVLPSVTAMHAMDQEERIGRTFLRFGRYTVWLYALVAVPTILFAKEIVLLYAGQEFNLAAFVLVVMMSTELVVMTTMSMTSELAMARGRMAGFASGSLLVEAITVALTLYLVAAHRLGAAGPAVASAATALLIRPLVIVPIAMRLANLSLRLWVTKLLIPGGLPLLCGAAILLPLKLIWAPRSWAHIGMYVVVSLVVQALIVWSFSLRDDDKQDALRMGRSLAMVLGRRRSSASSVGPV